MSDQILLQKEVKKEKLRWDEISIEELDRLMIGIERFYEERGNPKFNAVHLADTILKRVRNDKDFWINVEGMRGFGKSNLSLLLAILIHRYSGLWKNKISGQIVQAPPRLGPLPEDWEHIKCGFEFNRNMSFLDNHAEVKNKYNLLSRYGSLVIDEGTKVLHKYGWQSKVQFLLVQMSATERYQNKICFVAFPNFGELNSVFRNERIMMRLYVYARNTSRNYASCIISIKDSSRHTSDPWHYDLNAKLYEEAMKRIPFAARASPENILKAERKLRGYIGNFDIPSIKHLAPRIWNIYMKYKVENAQKELTETVDEKEIEFEKKMFKWKWATNSLISYIKELNPSITFKQIAQVSALSPSQISSLKGEMNKNLEK